MTGGLHMLKQAFLFCLTICCIALFTTPVTFGQSATVNDMTGQEVSADQLVNALTPKDLPSVQSSGHTRGIGLRPPDCTHLHQAATEAASRGIAAVAKADPVAITVEFASGSAGLTPADEKILANLGTALNSATLKPCCFEIQGYTDSIGGAAYNQKLSERRAKSVVEYLSGQDDVERDRMLARGFGKSQPLADNDTAEGRTRNRRVQIVNLGYGNTEEK
jgi:outer membrane protein OmpA-like peptidoglycan-associated protein